ncbi:MAG: T9SS type A sorting domain-containing protein [Bacteroidales bacterium]|nr:T9SS type A sorting domain-containing protein [Bacteroidales bacterium]
MEDEVLYSEQQVALNPTNMFKLSLVTEYVNVSGLESGSPLEDEPFSEKQPPSIASTYSRFPNSFLSQLIKAVNKKTGISIFLIILGLRAQINAQNSYQCYLLTTRKLSINLVFTFTLCVYFAHPGTYVAHEMSLQQAVANGIVSISGKDVYWGDAISISAQNTVPYTSNTEICEIFIEFYGTGATSDNVKRIENAIETMWSNKTTSDGKTLNVDVQARLAWTDADMVVHRGTAGYHQIKLDPTVPRSYVSGFKTDFDLNSGIGSGSWNTQGDQLEETYAHEAGHLMGQPDQYIEYKKQSDGNWKRSSDNQIFSSENLAIMYSSNYGMSEADLKTQLDTRDNRITPPEPSHENDLMANLDGIPLQSYIDQIASNAQLVIKAKAGDTFISKDDSKQNIVITRDEYLYLGGGQSIQLDGIYGACIDANKDAPSLDSPFDVSPNLVDWSNIEAAGYLHQLLTYINENDLYCDVNYDYQKLIWRITDNDFNYNRSLDANLVNAGIDIGDRMLDFPRILNPFPNSSGSHYIIPRQLYTIGLQASPGFIVNQSQVITIDAKVSVLKDDNIVSDFNWKLIKKPAGSTSQLSAMTGNSVNLSPDIRGIYKLNIEASFTDLSNLDAVVLDSQLIVLADKYTETFESGNLSSSAPFVWVTSDPVKWEITNEVPHTGTYSICSGRISDNGKSEISLNIVTSENDLINFAYKVSSEKGFDFLRFYIDGSLISSWSGESDWSIASYPIQKGSHTLKWAYEKDDYFQKGADRSWIDDIFLPNSTITYITKDLSINDYKVIAYPNPVKQNLTLRFYVGSRQKITVCMYDINGKFIRLLIDEFKEPGIQTETYNFAEISSGIYFIKIQNNENSITSNISFIKE